MEQTTDEELRDVLADCGLTDLAGIAERVEEASHDALAEITEWDAPAGSLAETVTAVATIEAARRFGMLLLRVAALETALRNIRNELPEEILQDGGGDE